MKEIPDGAKALAKEWITGGGDMAALTTAMQENDTETEKTAS